MTNINMAAFQTLMSAQKAPLLVMTTPHVRTPRGPTSASVMRASAVMASLVKVSKHLIEYTFVCVKYPFTSKS